MCALVKLQSGLITQAVRGLTRQPSDAYLARASGEPGPSRPSSPLGTNSKRLIRKTAECSSQREQKRRHAPGSAKAGPSDRRGAGLARRQIHDFGCGLGPGGPAASGLPGEGQYQGSREWIRSHFSCGGRCRRMIRCVWVTSAG